MERRTGTRASKEAKAPIFDALFKMSAVLASGFGTLVGALSKLLYKHGFHESTFVRWLMSPIVEGVIVAVLVAASSLYFYRRDK